MTSYTLRTLLRDRPAREVDEIWRRWQDGAGPPADRTELLAALTQALADRERVAKRLQELATKQSDLLYSFLTEPARARTAKSLMNGSFQTRYEVEAALNALQRDGFLFATQGRSWDSYQEPGWAVPVELAECIEQIRREQRSELLEAITLRGFLDARLGRRQSTSKPTTSSDHARKIYKIYLMESSIRSRIAKLPPAVAEVFQLALAAHGGLLPVDELRRVTDEEPDVELVQKCLEEAMLGTVAPLKLSRFGIQPVEQCIVVFYEIVLITLPWHSHANPPIVEQSQCAGVDLVSNVSRFLREVAASKVQFTVDGNLYKASEKRIEKSMLALPGDAMDGPSMMRFLYRFSLTRRLIDRAGDRGLRTTDAGRDFDERSLQEKLRALLSFAVEERDLPGDPFHQVRLRRILLRHLKRTEAERWHEAPFLPFLARNNYLTRLHELKVEESLAARFHGGGYVPGESVQQIAWNLLHFVKRRLHPLGIVDLGLRAGRPVALRVTRLGAELLGMEPAARLGGHRSTVLVNPDFEVILFPGEDEHAVVHAFDRFAERTKSDHTHHFRLGKDSVQAGLRDGLTLSQIVQELSDRCRAVVPQNVLYSLEDWADEAQVLSVEAGPILRARRREDLERALGAAGLGDHFGKRLSPVSVALKSDAPLDTVVAVLRDSGFAVARDPSTVAPEDVDEDDDGDRDDAPDDESGER